MASTVTEQDLDFAHFHCCGDEDLHPFRCVRCYHVMVFCYECDTLYRDLTQPAAHHDGINASDPSRPAFACPRCGFAFEYFFMRNAAYEVPLEAWKAAGLEHLLTARR